MKNAWNVNKSISHAKHMKTFLYVIVGERARWQESKKERSWEKNESEQRNKIKIGDSKNLLIYFENERVCVYAYTIYTHIKHIQMK